MTDVTSITFNANGTITVDGVPGSTGSSYGLNKVGNTGW